MISPPPLPPSSKKCLQSGFVQESFPVTIEVALTNWNIWNIVEWSSWKGCIYSRRSEASSSPEWQNIYLLIWMKAFHKAQLKILRTASQVEKRIENKQKTENTALHLVCFSYIKCLIFQDFILMAPRFCKFSHFWFCSYWQTRVTAMCFGYQILIFM